MKHFNIPRLSVAFALIALCVPATVAADYMSAPQPLDQSNSFVVSFNGEGEAAVSAQIRYTNYGVDPVDSVTFSIPGERVRVRRVIQRYSVTGDKEVCTQYSNSSTCITWENRPFQEDLYATVEPRVVAEDGASEVTVPFKQPLKPQDGTTLYVSYKAAGYAAEKKLGLFRFDFVTPKFGYDIDSTYVTVYADPTLYLQKDGRAKVGHAPRAMEALNSASISDSGKLDGMSLDSGFYGQTYDDSSIAKSTNNLDPYDTLTVSGAYATSPWRLSWPYLALTLAGVLAFIAIIAIGERRMAQQHLTKKGV